MDSGRFGNLFDDTGEEAEEADRAVHQLNANDSGLTLGTCRCIALSVLLSVFSAWFNADIRVLSEPMNVQNENGRIANTSRGLQGPQESSEDYIRPRTVVRLLSRCRRSRAR